MQKYKLYRIEKHKLFSTYNYDISPLYNIYEDSRIQEFTTYRLQNDKFYRV
jgi:hypothetical protein